MRVRLRHITLLVIGLLWGSVSMAQTIGDFKMDETELYAMTKQMGQFMRRFNYEEDQFGYKLNPKDPKYRSNEMRRQSLPILFDQEKYGKQTDLQRYFIEDVTKGDSTYMTFLGGRWYSEVSATFKYYGQNVNILLILAVEQEGLGSKWVFTNIYFPDFNKMFPTGEMAEKEKHFLHPMSHELDFMNIYKAFQDPEVIEYYASKDYQPDYLTLFFYEIKKTCSRSRTGILRCRGSTARASIPAGSCRMSFIYPKRKRPILSNSINHEKNRNVLIDIVLHDLWCPRPKALKRGCGAL